MVIITPYVKDGFTAYLGEVVSTTLSLAVRLIDDFTEREPLGRIEVVIKQGNIRAFKNLSGYYCFTDLTPGNYDVGIESGFYLPGEATVDTSFLDPKNPVIEITLKPRPSYHFPNNATLVRGLVSNTAPVMNAQVEVVGKPIETLTDEKGEFVLYFKGIKHEGVSIEIRKGGNTKTVGATVEEGKTVSLGVISFP
jgi:hypothetical protein